jgi:spore coat protein H
MESPPVLVETAPPVRPRWSWGRRLLVALVALLGVGVVLVVSLVVFAVWAWQTGRVTRWMMEAGNRDPEHRAPLERPWPPAGTPPGVQPPDLWTGPRESAAGLTEPSQFYRVTNVWEVQLRFTAARWEAMQLQYIRPGMNFLNPGTQFPLRNPEAPRNGLAGVIGMVQPWSVGDVSIGGVEFPDSGVRIKGNGTLMGAWGSFKKPYKVELDREVKGRSLAGATTFNLGNLASDFSGLSDTLAYEVFRDAGVPGPRTAFARVRLTVEGQFQDRPLGLYVMAENPDARWAKGAFHGRDVALFKPVTYELFADLGQDWAAYEGIYDPKGKSTEDDHQRVMAAARWWTTASDAEVAAKYGEYVDADEVARFIAVHALISSYDGFLNNGQNYLMYLDRADGRFGFIPWDQDQAWGEFTLVGGVEELEQASILHPWIANHRFLERLFAVPDFQARYRREVERIHRDLLDPVRLARRVDELAACIQATVDEESDYRRERFREAIRDDWSPEAREVVMDDPQRPVHQLKRFFVKRAEAVRAQLAGETEGHRFRVRKDPAQPNRRPQETK